MEIHNISLIIFMFLIFSFCGEQTEGLRPTPEGKGPVIVWDLNAKPLPQIPLPNDAATIIDPSSPTGKRINVSLYADTKMESDVRKYVDRMDGWGIISPISVKFDSEIDVSDLLKRQRDNYDFKDDAVLVINIDEKSKDFGKAVYLDMCKGNFPVTLGIYGLFFENDPHHYDNNVLFEEWDEDLNHNGKLDPGEDRDFDHVLDKPNIFPEGACDSQRAELADAVGKNDSNLKEIRKKYDQCMVSHLLTCYERESNTLIMRPIMPMDQQSRYAVVITDRLKGANGESVRSPFPYINHVDQTDTLKPLDEILQRPEYGLSMDNVAFAWSFNTGGPTRDMEAIRQGLYGSGPLKNLKEKFPITSFKPGQMKDAGPGNIYMIPAEELLDILSPYIPLFAGSDVNGVNALIEDLKQLDHLVIAVFDTPYFLTDKDGVATQKYPADDDESFEIDLARGTFVAEPQKVRALCAVPRETDKFKQPFELVIYAHGYVGFVLEGLGFAGRMAHFGFATCILEAMGHGIAVPPDMQFYVDLISPIFKEKNVYSMFKLVSPGRARDLNNDGFEDSGGDFWTADLFHTRDVVRQTLVDHLQFIRILRHFNGDRYWDMDLNGDGKNELMGDFDADGHVDFGGPGRKYYAWGQSLGGFISALLGAIEPSINAVAPISGAGGLTDVAIRSQNFGVPEAVMLPMMGPFVLGNPAEDGKLKFEFLLADVVFQKKLPIKVTDKANPGDRVVLKNLRNGKEADAVIPADMKFRLAISCDALTATEKRPVLKMKDDNSNVPVKVENPFELGDPIEIRIYDGLTDNVREVINKFGSEMEFNAQKYDGIVWQGAFHPKDSTLICLQKGHGYLRQSPDLRRIFNIASFILEAADPAVYARYFVNDKLNFDYEKNLEQDLGEVYPDTKYLIVPTAGDLNVPINAGVEIARAAGILDFLNPEQKWNNKTANEMLIDYHILEGVDRLDWFGDGGLLPDSNNLSDGKDGYTCVRIDPPVRASVKGNNGYHALRIPYIPVGDRHGFDIPHPDDAFDMHYYMTNVVAYWMFTKGNPLDLQGNFALDNPCYEKATCDFFPDPAKNY